MLDKCKDCEYLDIDLEYGYICMFIRCPFIYEEDKDVGINE